MRKPKPRPKTCFGSLNPSDHNFGFPENRCLLCGAWRSQIYDDRADAALKEALDRIP